MKIYLILLTFISFSAFSNSACPSYKAQICHAGSEKNPNFVDLCVSFSSLWGHFAHHELDYYGPCRLKNLKNPYVCNAGMRHKDAATEVCYKIENDEIEYVNECGDSYNCYCSPAQVANNFDYFSISIGEFNPFNEQVSNITRKDIHAGKNDFATATQNPLFSKIIADNGMSFNLGTERLNGEYFVDMCWVNTTGLSDYELDFNLTSRIDSAEHTNRSYSDVSGVQTKFQLLCDFSNTDDYSSSNLSLVKESSYTPFNIGGIFGFNFKVESAKYCILRQRFVEVYPEFLRPNDLKKITVENKLNAIDVPNYQDSPIQICHVEAVKEKGKNGYKCTQFTFTNSDALKNYIVTFDKNKDFQDIHQHDYVGICNNTCGPIHGNGAN